jgi:hypothetical protein
MAGCLYKYPHGTGNAAGSEPKKGVNSTSIGRRGAEQEYILLTILIKFN